MSWCSDQDALSFSTVTALRTFSSSPQNPQPVESLPIPLPWTPSMSVPPFLHLSFHPSAPLSLSLLPSFPLFLSLLPSLPLFLSLAMPFWIHRTMNSSQMGSLFYLKCFLKVHPCCNTTLILFTHVYVCVWIYACVCGCPEEARQGCWIPWSGDTGCCELPDMSDGSWTLVLHKSSKC